MRLSKFFNFSSDNLDFYDLDLDEDTALFLEPGHIFTGKDQLSRLAWLHIQDFFTSLIAAYSEDASDFEKLMVVEHLHEINATKLGYGNGRNGKAKTPEGMLQTFSQLGDFLKQGVPISMPFDFPIFFPRFDVDCLSDIMTNILLSCLSEYTYTQCNNLHVPSRYFCNPKKTQYYWSIATHSWEVCQRKQLIINGEMILLVPKRWLGTHLFCNTDHFLRHMILHTLQDQQTNMVDGRLMRPAIKDLANSLHDEYGPSRKIVINFVRNHPYLLHQYHRDIYAYYQNSSTTCI